jgi:hypothetical protein
MKVLNDIMKYYGTDKMAENHNYVEFYENIFKYNREKFLNLLEIGIFRPTEKQINIKKIQGISVPEVGASLKTWYDYLPNSKVYGIDINDFSDINNDRIKTFICNQESRQELENVMSSIGLELDIIIDDGGHTMKQHQISLSTLFKHLKSGGIYVIEDLHTCRMDNYVRGDKTTLSLIDEFINKGKIISKYISDEDSFYLENNIDRIEVKMGSISEIALIYKK